MPDVFTLENTQAAIFFAQFPGCFADLSAKGVDDMHDQYPAFTWSDFQIDGKTYGIPSDTGAAAIFSIARSLLTRALMPPQLRPGTIILPLARRC
jgi:maltose-binding protein MalE